MIFCLSIHEIGEHQSRGTLELDRLPQSDQRLLAYYRHRPLRLPTMAAISDPSGQPVGSLPPPQAERWTDKAARQGVSIGGSAADYSKTLEGIYDEAYESVSSHALALQKTFNEAAASARSRISTALADSSALLQETKGSLEALKKEYAVYEDMVFGKIKENVIIAASHPGLSCGVAAGLGLVVFRRPRQMLIRNIRRLFVSEESLLSDAEAKVNQLRQSINLVKNESAKLEERASKAEAEFEKGRLTLINEGREIQKELRYINRIEKETLGLKELICELPGRQASTYKSQLSNLTSQLKETKEDLTNAITRLDTHGIRM